MREDKAVALGGAASGIAAGAAANRVAEGAVGLTGIVARGAAQVIMAGDQGWDENGDFVSASFIFNFRDRKVFDGKDTYDIAEVTNVSYEGHTVTLTISGKAFPVKRNVGVVERSQVILRMFEVMRSGDEMLPEGKRLKDLSVRRNQISAGTIFRFAGRAVFWGFLLSFFTIFAGMDTLRQFVLELWFAIIFFGSVAHRKLRSGSVPSWTTPSHTTGKKVGIACLALTIFFSVMLPMNISDYKSLRGGYTDKADALDVCDSYYFYPSFVRVAMPWKWWCDPHYDSLMTYRDEQYREQYKMSN
ncbi:hypothetical protein [Rhizobium sp. MHM7A]|uniref:hypothetical protein n=1 Tax=Rhizobium sp. MHM7A TaxID=2583233 RepID=UPI001105C86A|nr:hypothetical protein [Rhizobium sp. MHM7A]TLX16965.1 hypothetical protein FFR93_06505 [Rhizobium sp. MHM7A]